MAGSSRGCSDLVEKGESRGASPSGGGVGVSPTFPAHSEHVEDPPSWPGRGSGGWSKEWAVDVDSWFDGLTMSGSI